MVDRKMKMGYQVHEVPERLLEKWQKTIDLMARLYEAPAGLIMRVGQRQIEVLVSSHSDGNPYERCEKADLGTGLYCETVMASRSQLHVPNALQDEDWKANPDVKLNMICYLGIPLIWPDGQIFGTICVLDNKTRNYSELYQTLLWEFKGIIERDFKITQQNEELKQEITGHKRAEVALQCSHNELELQVQERTSLLADSNIQLKQKIDERKRAEDRTRLLLDNLPCLAMIIKKGTREIVASNSAARLVGAIPGATCYETCVKRQEPCTFCKAPEMWDTDETQEIEVEYEGVWYRCIWVPFDDNLFVHYIFDITDQKRAEEEREKVLHDKGERVKELRCMYDIAESIQTRTTLEEIFQDVVDLIPPGWHYPEITRGKVIFDGKKYISEPFEETKWKQSSDIIVNGESRGSIEVYYLDECPVLDEGPFLTEERNLINGVAKSISEAVERKQAEGRLHESEEKYRSITERTYDVIIAANLDGEISYVSPSARRVFGYLPEELIGKNITEFVPEAEVPHAIETLQLSAAGQDVEGHHSKFLKKDGSYASIELNAVPIYKNDKITGSQAVIRDITETKRLQALESRAERLELAGTIAGQVAHDLNNLLAPITAYPEMIHNELPPDHKAHAYLDAIEEAAENIAEISQDLLTMGRRGHYNQKVFDINQVILQIVTDIQSRIQTVTVETDLCKDLMKMKGGSAQIQRALLNILVNAGDAMDGTGQITIKTENYYADDTSIAFGKVPKGEYVKLTISDTGCGIPDDIVQQILDPFFSTKRADKKQGSGLGLSIVDAVVKDHGGYLDLKSKVGYGTSFYLYFPISREDAAENESAHLTGGTEAVLIVDDDDAQREVSSKLLTKLGYKVCSVVSGEEAIEFLSENPQDLVVLDMIMPGGIDGTETYRQILEINPTQKAIFLSGYSESDRVLEAQKLGAGAFVKKPITKQVIAAAVRTELDRDAKVLA